MPYLFSVNETNRHICVANRLFGVPKTERARSQILNVRKGDRLYLYVYGTGLVYGTFEAITDPYEEHNPEQGPWNLGPIDKKHGYYPYRIHVDVKQLHETGVPFKMLERLDIGLSINLLQQKSAVYLSDFQADALEELFVKSPIIELREHPKKYSDLESLYSKEVSVTNSQEKALQLLVQKHFHQLEDGLRPVTSYFNIDYGTVRGEIDVLGRDKQNNYVVAELKAENAKKDIWTQLLTYSHVIRDIYANNEHVDVRSFIICQGFEKRTLYSYPELKHLLKRDDMVKIFKYDTNFKDSITFSEIPIKV